MGVRGGERERECVGVCVCERVLVSVCERGCVWMWERNRRKWERDRNGRYIEVRERYRRRTKCGEGVRE